MEWFRREPRSGQAWTSREPHLSLVPQPLLHRNIPRPFLPFLCPLTFKYFLKISLQCLIGSRKTRCLHRAQQLEPLSVGQQPGQHLWQSLTKLPGLYIFVPFDSKTAYGKLYAVQRRIFMAGFLKNTSSFSHCRVRQEHLLNAEGMLTFKKGSCPRVVCQV